MEKVVYNKSMKIKYTKHEANNFLVGYTISFLPEDIIEELILNGLLRQLETNDKNDRAYLEVEIAGLKGKLS